MPPINIVEKVKKLLMLATSDNIHEAAAAMARAQDLIDRHDIDEEHLASSHTDVSDTDLNAGETAAEIEHRTLIYTFPTTRADTWILILCGAVTKANLCRGYYVSGIVGPRWSECATYSAFGPPHRLDLCQELIPWLVDEVKRLLTEEKRKGVCLEGKSGATRAWNNAFLNGAAATVRTRLLEGRAKTRQKVLDEARRDAANEDSRAAEYRLALAQSNAEALLALDRLPSVRREESSALVKVVSSLARLDSVESRVEDEYKRYARAHGFGSGRSSSISSPEGFAAGKAAGARASLGSKGKLTNS